MDKRVLHRLLIVISILIFGMGLFGLSQYYAAYSEFSQIGGDSSHIRLNTPNQQLIQNFSNPYTIIHGIQLKVGTYKHHNNATWNIRLEEQATGKEIYSWQVLGVTFKDNQFNYLKTSYPIRVSPNQTYTVYISSDNVTSHNPLAFYTSDKPADGAQAVGNLVVDGVETDRTLAFRIVGGTPVKRFMLTVISFLTLLLIWVGLRIYKLGFQLALKDKYIQAFCIGLISFLMMLIYINGAMFLDEIDNLHAGIRMANGYILYKDYVTQHPPATMFIIALYAVMGAVSVQMFRILFYITVASIFAFLYSRHKDFFGGKRIAILFFFWITVLCHLYNRGSWRLLEDSFTALGVVLILFEFLRYFEDRQITPSRSAIIAIGLYISVGSYFLMVYPLVWMILTFIVIEGIEWRKSQSITLNLLIRRYGLLVVLSAIPVILTFAYFWLNNGFSQFIEQTYFFNREVYVYYRYIGDSLLSPLILGISNFIEFLYSPIAHVANADLTPENVFLVSASMLFLFVITQLIYDKKWMLAISLVGIIILTLVRGYRADHAAPFAFAISAIIFLMLDIHLKPTLKRIVTVIALIMMLYMGKDFYSSLSRLSNSRPTITAFDYQLVQIANQVGTDQPAKIFIESFNQDTLYPQYKLGLPVNRVPYMLPWYMAWYMPWSLEDLDKASVAVYRPNQQVWGYDYSDFNREFLRKLETDFERVEGDIWVRKQ
jgi:hypothetical protein